MESQDLKVGRISEPQSLPAFASLETSRRLQALADEIEKQNAASKERSDNSDNFDKLEKLLTRILAELLEIKEILAQSSAPASAPEANETE